MHELRRFKAEFFKALSNPLRIAILDTLRTGERGVGEIAAELAVEQAAASQQLAVLRSKNLVRYRKQGTFVYYSVTDPTLFAILDDAARLFQNHLVDLQSLLSQEVAAE
ncbi:MAG: winged helix-turn-helix domain-containing protein [Cyanobacteria bacterium REEB65]|nr:winged helix-turn-helix domain-containing protein [Cyanobacteria bacterium REEB65]